MFTLVRTSYIEGNIEDQVLEIGKILLIPDNHFTGHIGLFLVITFYFDLCGNTIFCRNKQYFYALTLFHCDYLK